ncbi:MAG: GIY-YIG nuclease family protein [Candidatus Cybelea sp.]
METYYVYMLLCSDGSFYTGITNDLEYRVAQHQYGEGHKAYTFSRRPVKLVYATDFHDVLQAIAWEKHVKGWSRTKKQALVVGDWPQMHKLAACLNETSHTGRTAVSSFDSAQDDIPFDFAQDDKGHRSG